MFQKQEVKDKIKVDNKRQNANNLRSPLFNKSLIFDYRLMGFSFTHFHFLIIPLNNFFVKKQDWIQIPDVLFI